MKMTKLKEQLQLIVNYMYQNGLDLTVKVSNDHTRILLEDEEEGKDEGNPVELVKMKHYDYDISLNSVLGG